MSQQMARGRREIKKIEDKSSRQVTFSKRRAGLFKKAKELVVLCDATVLLFTFSPAGKLFEYSSSNMEMIMDKYLDYPPTSRSSISSTSDDNLHRNDMELVKMNQFCQDLTRICSQMNGADLESLDLKQLQELEDGLAGGLKSIKSRKDELLMMQIQEYLQREPELTEENRNLGALSGQRQLRTVMEFTSLGNLEMPGDCRNQRSNDHHHNGEKEVIQDSLTSLHLGLPDVQ